MGEEEEEEEGGAELCVMGRGKRRKSRAPIILPKARFLTSNSITRVKGSRWECGAGSLELKFRRRRLGGGRMLSLSFFVRSFE